MEKMSVKIVSLFVLLWYCASFIGFDVHTCSFSGRSFVSTLLSGYTCEDIHPEHSCSLHGHDCCHDHDCHGHEESCCNDGDSLEPSSCCQDNINILQLTGLNQNDNHRSYDGFAADVLCSASNVSYGIGSSSENNVSVRIPIPGSGLLVQGDAQAVLAVWRI